jgi:hypothetical protein
VSAEDAWKALHLLNVGQKDPQKGLTWNDLRSVGITCLPDRITTGSAPVGAAAWLKVARSVSAAVNARPTIGEMPATAKKSCVTWAARTTSAGPSPLIVRPMT